MSSDILAHFFAVGLPPKPAPSSLDWTVGIDALPVEILRQIFLIHHKNDCSTAGPFAFEQRPVQREYHGSTKLSHVCRLWNAVAYDVPELWSTLRYGVGASARRAAERLSRTTDSPIAVAVSIGPGLAGEEVISILAMLEKEHHRIRHLALEGKWADGAVARFKKIDSWDRLEHLDLELTCIASQPSDLLFKAAAPKLAFVTLFSRRKTHNIGPQGWPEFLKSYQKTLHTLKLDGISMRNGPTTGFATLSALRILDMSTCQSFKPFNVIRTLNLQMPVLAEIHLPNASPDYGGYWAMREGEEGTFVFPEACHVHLWSKLLKHEISISSLPQMYPNVSTLTLRDISEIHTTNDIRQIWPKLECLRIVCRGTIPAIAKLASDIVHEKRNGEVWGPLRSLVTLTNDMEPRTMVLDGLESLSLEIRPEELGI